MLSLASGSMEDKNIGVHALCFSIIPSLKVFLEVSHKHGYLFLCLPLALYLLHSFCFYVIVPGLGALGNNILSLEQKGNL